MPLSTIKLNGINMVLYPHLIKLKVFNYMNGTIENIDVADKDMCILPNKILAYCKCTFEPKTHVSDSLTYDITAWSLPYIYGLKLSQLRPFRYRYRDQKTGQKNFDSKRSLWLLSKMGYNQWIKVSSGYIKQ